VYLTVLGFARLHSHVEEIVQKSNGRAYRDNPGVQLLEVTCGMTMHGDRTGAVALLRNAPMSLLEAYRLAKMDKRGTGRFFKEAFDRTADPCLEGRMGRILEYLEKARKVGKSTEIAPWEDVSLQPIPPTAPVNDVVGEHMRVFINECTWRWAQDKGIEYEAAKKLRHEEPHAEEFNKAFNADTFRAAMVARNVVKAEEPAAQWFVATDSGWMPFEAGANQTIEIARQHGQHSVQVRLGPKGWSYDIDLVKFVQRNKKNSKERPIKKEARRATASSSSASSSSKPTGMRQLSPEELEGAVRFFIDMATLPEGPSAAASV